MTTFPPVTAISPNGPFMSKPRSIRKPDSFEELSVHDRLIWLEETASADKLLGSAGTEEEGEVGVRVGGGPEVKVRVGVGVGVRVQVGVRVAVGDDPGVAVRVGVGVDVRVGVAVGGARVVADATFENRESPAEL